MTDLWSWQGGTVRHLGDALRNCLLAAVAAPSIHNMQPWRFRLHHTGIDVLVDRSRRLEVIDPRGREVIISVGAALLNLRVAILAHGRTPMTCLFPVAAEPDLVARVTLGPPVHVSETARRLAQAIPHRHTSRRPFADRVIPDDVLADLRQAATVEGGHLTLADAGSRDAILSLVRIAEKHRHSDANYWFELGTWTHQWPHRRDGVPPEAYGPWSALESMPIRDFGLVGPVRRRKTATFETEPTLAVLYSAGDTARDWIVVGQALERILLTATVHGVSNTLMTQPLEEPHLRELLVDTTRGRIPQAIMRLGYGPPSAPTPRRTLEEVVDGLVSPVPGDQVSAR
jgi:nitroreductase